MAPLAPEIPTTIFKIGLSRRALFRIQNKIGYICLAWEPAPGYNRKRYIGARAPRQGKCSPRPDIIASGISGYRPGTRRCRSGIGQATVPRPSIIAGIITVIKDGERRTEAQAGARAAQPALSGCGTSQPPDRRAAPERRVSHRAQPPIRY